MKTSSKFAIMILLIISSSQCFASASLNSAFANAMKASEYDHKSTQVALSVSPDQIEKATFKRGNTVQIVEVEADMLTDSTKSAFEERPVREPTTADGFAQLKDDLEEL